MMPETADEPQELDLEKALEAEGKPKPPGVMDPASFPDGGAKAWLATSGAFACLFCSFGWVRASSELSPMCISSSRNILLPRHGSILLLVLSMISANSEFL